MDNKEASACVNASASSGSSASIANETATISEGTANFGAPPKTS